MPACGSVPRKQTASGEYADRHESSSYWLSSGLHMSPLCSLTAKTRKSESPVSVQTGKPEEGSGEQEAAAGA